jgi:hypothetical protein
MSEKPLTPPPAKGDRNPHEVSGEESRPAETHGEHTRGGGHRSGSRGAGTFENSDGKAMPHQQPQSREPHHVWA